ncbi:hypothetical protein [Streptomyces sp. NPDC006638]|uniref:hypothetical protein n=1 Tax=Streptomyces sp. NPDC006638 TaxID=3157183 RepID=UPI0033B5A604
MTVLLARTTVALAGLVLASGTLLAAPAVATTTSISANACLYGGGEVSADRFSSTGYSCVGGKFDGKEVTA